jgi:hypothetical protein
VCPIWRRAGARLPNEIEGNDVCMLLGLVRRRNSQSWNGSPSMAEFEMILRDLRFKGSGSLGTVVERARQGIGADANRYRAGFLELVRKAQPIESAHVSAASSSLSC